VIDAAERSRRCSPRRCARERSRTQTCSKGGSCGRRRRSRATARGARRSPKRVLSPVQEALLRLSPHSAVLRGARPRRPARGAPREIARRRGRFARRRARACPAPALRRAHSGWRPRAAIGRFLLQVGRAPGAGQPAIVKVPLRTDPRRRTPLGRAAARLPVLIRAAAAAGSHAAPPVPTRRLGTRIARHGPGRTQARRRQGRDRLHRERRDRRRGQRPPRSTSSSTRSGASATDRRRGVELGAKQRPLASQRRGGAGPERGDRRGSRASGLRGRGGRDQRRTADDQGRRRRAHREKIVAAACRRFVCIVDRSKVVASSVVIRCRSRSCRWPGSWSRRGCARSAAGRRSAPVSSPTTAT